MTLTSLSWQLFFSCLVAVATAELSSVKTSALLQVSTAAQSQADSTQTSKRLLEEADQPVNGDSVSGDDTLVLPQTTTPPTPPRQTLKIPVNSSETHIKAPVVLNGALFDSDWKSRWVPSGFISEVSSWGTQKKCAMKVTYKPQGTNYVNPPSGQLTEAKSGLTTVLKKKKVKVDMPKIVYKEVEVPVNITSERFVYQATNKTVTRYVDEVKVVKSNRTVEVPEIKVVDTYVRVVEVPILTNITQEEVVYQKMKKVVERKVEVPKVSVKKRQVQTPVYQEVIKEVPKIEIRQRTVEVVREEIQIVPTNETVSLTQEVLVENKVQEKKKKVKVVRESAAMNIEEVEVPQSDVSVVDHEQINTISAVQHTNITQEVVEIEEEIETVEKVVEVVVEKEEIVEVPTFVTHYIDKEVVMETVREEIVQVPVSKTIEIVKEVPERVFENVSVVLKREHIETESNLSIVPLIEETVTAKPVKTTVTARNLIPKPYPISEYTLDDVPSADSLSGNSTGVTNSTESNTVTEEVIVQEFHEKEQVQTVEVPKITTVTKDVIVPVVQIMEEVVKVPRVRYEEEVIKVPKIQEVENIIEINDSDCLPEEDTPKAVGSKNKSLMQRATRSKKNELTSLLASLVERSQNSSKHAKKLREVNQTAQLHKKSSHRAHQGKNGSSSTSKKQKMNCTGFRIKRIEVPQTNIVKKQVVVPIYEIEEKIIEVPIESEVEEIEEVPVVVNVTTIVEVPQIEYNDTIVEKVVLKRVTQVAQKPANLSKTKFASRTVEVLEVEEATKTVPLKVQVAKYAPNAVQINSTTARDTLNVTYKTNEQQIKKKVKVKKRVEKLVPKEVVRTIQKHVKVMKNVSAERIVPIYRERTVQKRVEVETYSVHVVEKRKKLRWQDVTSTEEVVTKRVKLHIQQAAKVNKEKVVELKQAVAKVVDKTVPIAVPCELPPNKTLIAEVKTKIENSPDTAAITED